MKSHFHRLQLVFMYYLQYALLVASSLRVMAAEEGWKEQPQEVFLKKKYIAAPCRTYFVYQSRGLIRTSNISIYLE